MCDADPTVSWGLECCDAVTLVATMVADQRDGFLDGVLEHDRLLLRVNDTAKSDAVTLAAVEAGQRRGVDAFVGPPFSTQVIAAAPALRAPMVSGSTVLAALSNDTAYPWFQRTITTSDVEVAMVSTLIARMGWTNVAILVVADESVAVEAADLLSVRLGDAAVDVFRDEISYADAARPDKVDGTLRRVADACATGWEKGDVFSPFSRLLISSHVLTQFPLIVLDERSSLVEFSKGGHFP